MNKRSGHPKAAAAPLRRTVSSHIPEGLFIALSSAKPEGQPYKHFFFDQVFTDFIGSWAQARIPRAYIGTQGAKSRTFYLDASVVDALTRIADQDGVTLSQVIRTASAWYLHHRSRRADPWGTDAVFPTRRDPWNP